MIRPEAFGFIKDPESRNIYRDEKYKLWKWVVDVGPNMVNVITTKEGLIKFMGDMKNYQSAEIILDAIGVIVLK